MDAGTHLYERLADQLSEMIERGALRPGDRMPSVRRLSRQRHVSVATVVQAYGVLEDAGLVETRPQSGHYVRARRAAMLPEPRTARPSTSSSRVEVSDLISRLYGAMRDPGVLSLGAAMPDPQILPTEKLNRMTAAIAKTAGGAITRYDPPPGYLPLRRAIARRSADIGLALSEDDLITTFGATEALTLCLRAVARPGDSIVVESPTYFAMLEILECLGLRAVEVPAHPRTGLDLDALEDVLREGRVAACLAMPNFNNPLGSLMPDEAKEKLVGLLARREVPLIEDDLTGDVFFGAERPRPAKSFDRKGNVLMISSFSKTIAPGFRVGWVAPGRFRERVERLKYTQSLATATLPQMAITELIENGGYDHHLRKLRKAFASQVEHCREAVARHFPPETRVSRPQGGMFLWVELPPGVDAMDLFERALLQRISIVPGPVFSAKRRFGSCIRISAAHAWSDVIDRALATIGSLVGK